MVLNIIWPCGCTVHPFSSARTAFALGLGLLKNTFMPLLWVMCRRSPSHEAGSPISVAQAMVTRGERVGQTAELITALLNERLWADILLCQVKKGSYSKHVVTASMWVFWPRPLGPNSFSLFPSPVSWETDALICSLGEVPGRIFLPLFFCPLSGTQQRGVAGLSPRLHIMKNRDGWKWELRKGGLGSDYFIRGLLAYSSANQKSPIPRLLHNTASHV